MDPVNPVHFTNRHNAVSLTSDWTAKGNLKAKGITGVVNKRRIRKVAPDLYC
jgi:hypothetical protein